MSQVLGWNIVPHTWLGDGPHGPGMVQMWCEPDPDQHAVDLVPSGAVGDGWRHVFDGLDAQDRPVSLVHEDSPELRRMAVFDIVVNNADRKGGHVLAMTSGPPVRHRPRTHLPHRAQAAHRPVGLDRRTPHGRGSGRGRAGAHPAWPATSATLLTELLTADEVAALAARCDRLLSHATIPGAQRRDARHPLAPVLMTSDALLVGCGRLGSDIGLRLAALGHEVVAIRRHADQVPAPLQGISADLSVETPNLPPLDLDLLVVALTARPRSEEAYRATYVDGMARALDALTQPGSVPPALCWCPRRRSSATHPRTCWSTRLVLAAPTDGPGRMLLAAEELFAERVPGGTVLRLSGLYDGDSTRLTDRLTSGDGGDPHRWTNRIHRDDAAAAVVHLLTMDEQPDSLYVGTDDEPAQMGDVMAFLAGRLGVAAPARADPTLGTGKRLSNAFLRSTGWTPTFRTFRDGYAAPPPDNSAT